MAVRRGIRVAVGLSIAVTVGCGPTVGRLPRSPTPRAALVRQLERTVRGWLRRNPVAGVAVHVARGGRAALSRGYGLADVRRRRPVTPRTVFRVGSLTKMFTAVAVLRLVDRGALALQRPLRRYLPEYGGPGAGASIRQLLQHTAGVPDFAAILEAHPRELEQVPLGRAGITRLFARLPARHPPGAAWAYSNSHYHLLGLVIERVTKRRFATALRREVLAPAGVRGVAMCVERPADTPRGYRRQGGRLAQAAPIAMANPWAAGGLCASVEALARWFGALARGAIVAPKLLTRAWRGGRLPDGVPLGYGLGFGLGDLDGLEVVGHTGGIRGFRAQLLHVPRGRVTVVVLSNTETRRLTVLARRLARAAAFAGRAPARREVHPQAASGRYRLANGAVFDVSVRAGEARLRFGERTLRLHRRPHGGYCGAGGCDLLQVHFFRRRGRWGLMLQKDGVSLGALRVAARV